MNEMFVENGVDLSRARRPGDAVMLLGDSIRLGYCATVREDLADVAAVFYPDENCRHTHHTLTMLGSWATLCPPEQVRVVLFNCGHWDIAHWSGEPNNLTALPVYDENIGRIFDRLRGIYPHAAIAFVTTAPMNPNGKQGVNPRTNEEIIRYNRAAVQVIRERGGHIIDLFAAAEDWGEDSYYDYCHFTPEAFAQLGHIVAEEIRRML